MSRLRIAFAICLTLGITLTVIGCSKPQKKTTPPPSIKKPKAEYAKGVILVKFKPSVSIGTINSLNSKYGVLIINKNKATGVYRLRIPDPATVPEMVKIYGKNPNVEWAEEMSIFHIPEKGKYYSPIKKR